MLNKKHVSKKIRRKLKFFVIMFFISIGLSFYYFIKEDTPIKYPLIIFIIGIVIGKILSRIQNVTWDKMVYKL